MIDQRKAGFGAPVDVWLRRDLTHVIDDLLSVERLEARGLFDPEAVRTLVNGYRAGRGDFAYPIWALLTLEPWARAFIGEACALA